MQRLDTAHDDDMYFTAPLTVSKSDAAKLRKKLLELIANAGRIVDPSPSEELFCLNIDFIKV